MRLRLLSLYGDLRHVPPLRGRRRFGVPPGGPADPESTALAATLAGSPIGEVVELAFGEATFAVERGGTLAIVGAGWAERFEVASGETFALVPLGGARLALAAPGGWSTPPLGPDPDPEAALAVPKGGILESPEGRSREPLRIHTPPVSLRTGELRVVAGPQRALWPEAATAFEVAPWLDRHGIRLRGAPEHTHDIPSEPCLPGVVQWTPKGELIALGPDGPTIGGYPKPFVVIGADLPKLGQLLPGRSLRFVEVSLEEARRANETYEADLARRITLIRLAQ